MRWTAFFLLFATMAGCTTQSSGSRCQQNSDCNPDTDVCRNEASPERDCTNTACICCPSNAAAAAAIPACIPRVGMTDSGVIDTGVVAEAGTEAGTANEAGTEAGTGSEAGTDAGADAGSSADLGAAPDAGPSCAGNGDCGAGYFCYAAACAGAGRCTARPAVGSCATGLNAVCGCDLRTYTNACEAAAAGVRSTAGVCPAVDAGAPADAGADAPAAD